MTSDSEVKVRDRRGESYTAPVDLAQRAREAAPRDTETAVAEETPTDAAGAVYVSDVELEPGTVVVDGYPRPCLRFTFRRGEQALPPIALLLEDADLRRLQGVVGSVATVALREAKRARNR